MQYHARLLPPATFRNGSISAHHAATTAIRRTPAGHRRGLISGATAGYALSARIPLKSRTGADFSPPNMLDGRYGCFLLRHFDYYILTRV